MLVTHRNALLLTLVSVVIGGVVFLLNPPWVERENPLELYKQGVALNNEGDYDGAVRAYRKALELAPDVPMIHYSLGIALYNKDDLDGAVGAYRDALELDPEDPAAHANLGIALAEKGDLDGALTSLREAIRLDPDDAENHYNLGVALCMKGEPDGAIAALEESLRLDPEDSETLYNLGRAHALKKDATRAAEYLARAIALDADSRDLAREEEHIAEAEGMLQQAGNDFFLAAARGDTGLFCHPAQGAFNAGRLAQRFTLQIPPESLPVERGLGLDDLLGVGLRAERFLGRGDQSIGKLLRLTLAPALDAGKVDFLERPARGLAGQPQRGGLRVVPGLDQHVFEDVDLVAGDPAGVDLDDFAELAPGVSQRRQHASSRLRCFGDDRP